jgi:ribosomal protein S18 acetylase RimI-like enzyme
MGEAEITLEVSADNPRVYAFLWRNGFSAYIMLELTITQRLENGED